MCVITRVHAYSFTCICSTHSLQSSVLSLFEVCMCACMHVCVFGGGFYYWRDCYTPGEHILALSVVCLPLTGALLTLTQKDVCMWVCVCVCVAVWKWGLVFVLLLICVLDFLILAPSGVGRWATVCYTIWGIFAKNLYSRPLEICLWGGHYGYSMVQSWTKHWGDCIHFYLFICCLRAIF